MIPEIKKGREFEDKVSPHIVNEFSTLKKVLVVPTPSIITLFNDFAVNPIQKEAMLKQENIESQKAAAKRHGMLLQVFEDNNIELVYSDPKPTGKGHTPLFTRDVGVVIEDVYIPSRMSYEYRQVEVPAALEKINHENVYLTDMDYKLEGGDVVYLEKDLILIGIGPRTDANGLLLLQSLFPEKTFLPFSTVKEDKAFHIDTNMGVLGDKHLVVLLELVPAEIMLFLADRGYTFVEADMSEYETCCTNVIAIGDRKIIAPAENKITNQRIRESGVEVIEVELKEILAHGGGPHCLTLPLVRE